MGIGEVPRPIQSRMQELDLLALNAGEPVMCSCPGSPSKGPTGPLKPRWALCWAPCGAIKGRIDPEACQEAVSELLKEGRC